MPSECCVPLCTNRGGHLFPRRSHKRVNASMMAKISEQRQTATAKFGNRPSILLYAELISTREITNQAMYNHMFTMCRWALSCTALTLSLIHYSIGIQRDVDFIICLFLHLCPYNTGNAAEVIPLCNTNKSYRSYHCWHFPS